jgi:TetR/AcrR family transcriptional regulator, regulator of cefoperazone and chloramphenicol sensitivity
MAKAEPPLPEPAKTASREPAASAATKDNRSLSLVRAAYEVIAAEGFEGLRTRRVADRAGVNIATLHYYFPTKEALIRGLAEYLASLFGSVHAPPVSPTRSAALDRLRQEFADARFYRLERPDLLVVIQELMLRAHRDPAVRSIIAPLTYHWRAGLQQLIEEGISEGVFRPDLVPVVAATLVASAISGAINFTVGPEVLDSIFREIEQWLIISQKNKKPRKH